MLAPSLPSIAAFDRQLSDSRNFAAVPPCASILIIRILFFFADCLCLFQ
jgi:hypothetical protein